MKIHRTVINSSDLRSMPTYLAHGFRWERLSIRMHIIVNDLEDAASEWIVAPATSRALLQSFYQKYDFLPSLPSTLSDYISHQTETADSSSKNSSSENRNGRAKFHRRLRQQVPPHTSGDTKIEPTDLRLTPPPISYVSLDSNQVGKFNDWSPIKLLEQYDPNEMYECSQPYAFVADYVVKVELSVLLDEERQKYELLCAKPPCVDTADIDSMKFKEDGAFLDQSEPRWLEMLRDKLETNGEIGWFVINCGDEERKIEYSDLKRSKSPLNVSLNTALREILKGRNFLSKSKASTLET